MRLQYIAQEFYDDLNARNKAAAEEALARYEEEEREKLAAAEEEQKALEDSESETPAVLPTVVENETQIKAETESETQVGSVTPTSNTSPAALYVSSEPDFPKADFAANTSIIVAATLDEQETETVEEGTVESVVEENSEDVEKSWSYSLATIKSVILFYIVQLSDMDFKWAFLRD